MIRSFRLAGLLIASLTFTTGCKVSTSGDAGALNFAYQDPDNLLTRALDAPIVVGGQVRLKVRDADAKTAAQVTSAEVTGAAKLISFDGNTVVIEGTEAGVARVVVNTDQGEDSVNLGVADAKSVSLRPLSTAGQALVGGTEPLGVDRLGDDGEILVGEKRVPEVTVTDGIVERVEGPDHRVTVKYLTEGTAEIGLDASVVSRTVIGLDAVADFEALTLGESGRVGGGLIGYFQAKDAAQQDITGLGGLVVAEVADPSICTYTEGNGFGIEGARIDMLAEGTCQIDLTLGAHSAQWILQVEPAEQ